MLHRRHPSNRFRGARMHHSAQASSASTWQQQQQQQGSIARCWLLCRFCLPLVVATAHRPCRPITNKQASPHTLGPNKHPAPRSPFLCRKTGPYRQATRATHSIISGWRHAGPASSKKQQAAFLRLASQLLAPGGRLESPLWHSFQRAPWGRAQHGKQNLASENYPRSGFSFKTAQHSSTHR